MSSNHKKNEFHPIVGIDFGTTNSAIAYMHNKIPQILESANGEGSFLLYY